MAEAPSGFRARRQAIGGWLALVVVAALGMAFLGPIQLFAAGSARSAPTTLTGAVTGAVTEAGRGLYQSQCASCHGAQGEGTANGPTLMGSGAAAADFYLRTGRMPLSAPGQPVTRHEPVLTDEQIAQLTEVVAGFGAGPEIPQVAGGGDIGDGARLYIANCAACHGATGAGNAIGGGNLAANLDRATATEIVEALRIGPGAMPRFGFTPDEESAIVAYVQHLQAGEAPGGLTIGGFGAVAEGFVAIAVGLLLLVLIAMFVGRRTHEGEPPSGPLG